MIVLFLQASEKSPQQEPENDTKNAQKGEMMDCSTITFITHKTGKECTKS